MSKFAEVKVERTYRVVDAVRRSTYSHVKSAEAERGDDPTAARNEKRYAEAVRLKEGWLSRYDPTLHLEIVPCDRLGLPLVPHKPRPAPKPQAETHRAVVMRYGPDDELYATDIIERVAPPDRLLVQVKRELARRELESAVGERVVIQLSRAGSDDVLRSVEWVVPASYSK